MIKGESRRIKVHISNDTNLNKKKRFKISRGVKGKERVTDIQEASILIVDDNNAKIMALEAILADLNLNIVKCNSGNEALQHLLKHDYAVILLDVKMPGMDGFDTVKLIRQREKSKHTPIIFVTAFDTAEVELSRGYSLGAVDYILFPIAPEVLRGKVRVFVDLFRMNMELTYQAKKMSTINKDMEKEISKRKKAEDKIIKLNRELENRIKELEKETAERVRMTEIAMHDSLTGLMNRTAAIDVLARELNRAEREGKRVGVVMADIDNFKRINDNYGHTVGDAVLITVADKLRTMVRFYDTIGRYGGDEFLITLPGCDKSNALNIAKRINAYIAEKGVDIVDIKEGTILVTISIGISMSSSIERNDVCSLIRAADRALYIAKNNGRNRIELAEGYDE